MDAKYIVAMAVVKAAIRIIISGWFEFSVMNVPPTYGGRVGVEVGVGEGVGCVPLAYFKS